MDEINQDPISVERNQQPQPPQKRSNVLPIILAVLFVGLIIAGIVILAQQPEEVTGKVRDIFIILLAVEMAVIGVALIILIVQLASLSNLLQT